MNYVTNTFLLVSSKQVNNYCVLCTVKAKKENKNLQQRNLSGFITIPSINYDNAHFKYTFRSLVMINRGYYIAAQGHEFYLRVLIVSLTSDLFYL